MQAIQNSILDLLDRINKIHHFLILLSLISQHCITRSSFSSDQQDHFGVGPLLNGLFPASASLGSRQIKLFLTLPGLSLHICCRPRKVFHHHEGSNHFLSIYKSKTFNVTDSHISWDCFSSATSYTQQSTPFNLLPCQNQPNLCSHHSVFISGVILAWKKSYKTKRRGNKFVRV